MINEESVSKVRRTVLTPRVVHCGSALIADSSPTARRTLLSILGVLALLPVGCQPLFTDFAFTLLEVTDSESQAPVTGASVIIDKTIFGGFFAPPEECKTDVGPTNTLGRVHVSVTRFGERPFLVTLAVAVEIDGAVHRVEIENVLGAAVVSGTIVVRVVDVDAELPPPPEVEVVEGSNPVEIRFRGQFSSLSICSNSSDTQVWGVGNNGNSYFEGEMIVGSEPMLSECPGLTPSAEPGGPCNIRGGPFVFAPLLGPARGFTIYAQLAGSNDAVSVGGYCLDAVGAAVTCDGN